MIKEKRLSKQAVPLLTHFPASRSARAPQRINGRQRVEALLQAASEVIHARGYDAATMTEIAQRADAKIFSLYRFFPTKELLAEALLQRYREMYDVAYDIIDTQAASASVAKLADIFLDFYANIRDQMPALIDLLDARSEWSNKRIEFREQALTRIAGTLTLRAPKLSRKAARDIAVIMLINMKTMVAMTLDKSVASSQGSPNELRLMNCLYLTAKLREHSK